MLLERQGLVLPRTAADVYLVLAGERSELAGFALAERLRAAWPQLRLQVNLGGGGFKAQFKRADRSGARVALVLGEDELARGVVAVKSLREERAQEDCALDALSERLGMLLGLKGVEAVERT